MSAEMQVEPSVERANIRTRVACDVLIIGAGVAGCALAYKLADEGVNVAVVERGTVCSGSSALNAGGVRQQFRTEASVRLARRTVEIMSSFKQDFGVDVGYHQAGYLFLFGGKEQQAMLESAIALQNACGVNTRIVPAEELDEIVPGLDVEGLSGGAYGPTDGYLDPYSVVSGFAAAARRAGARFYEQSEVRAITTTGGRADGAVASSHEFAFDILVNTAGAWAPKIAALYGEDLPITARRNQIFLLDRTPAPGRWLPLTMDLTQTPVVYFHSEGPGLLTGSEEAPVLPERPFTVPTDWNDLPIVVEGILKRLPSLERAEITNGWAGLIEMTPDDNPIVGWTHLPNAYTIAGFSGVGMCLGPGVAEEAAREIQGKEPSLSLDAFRLERFESGSIDPQGLWAAVETR